MSLFDLFIVQPIFNLLMVIYSLIPGGDFGVALIIFTVIVRFAMWPLVKKQLHQTKKMQEMQPELARIKKEAAGNRQLEGIMMMELYKKHDVSPFRSIGILFIQLPIFIALYQVIQIFTINRDQIDKFTYGFLGSIEPIKNLIANPESFNEKLLGFLDLTKQAISQSGVDYILLALAIVAVITQYIMTKQTAPKNTANKTFKQIMTEAADGKEADQAEINAIVMGQMTKVLPLMMFFIMVSLPGALALYYTVSNIVAVIQQRRVLEIDASEMIVMADKASTKTNKKANLEKRVEKASEARITRIVAKDTAPKKGKKKEKI